MFENFYGNQKVKETLVTLIDDGRLSHGILLEGERGLGKKTLAKEIAKAVLCTGESKPCGVCRACKKIEAGVHPDFLYFSGGEGARSFHIDTIREIREAAYVMPNEGAAKVFLLSDVQNMTIQAQNALLKIIEEPPEQTMFLLTCDDTSALLTTILSRLVTLRLQHPSQKECEQALEKLAPEETPERRTEAANTAHGNIGEALALIRDETAMKISTDAKKLLQVLCLGSEYEMLTILYPYERQREQFVRLMDALGRLFCDIALSRYHTARQDTRQYGTRISQQKALKAVELSTAMRDKAIGNANIALLSAGYCGKLKSMV